MKSELSGERSLVMGYLALRKAIGVLGIALPFVVWVGALVLFGQGTQRTISDYYYTGMRDWLVGMLWAIGFFLLSYRGTKPIHDLAGDLACVFAVCASFLPTAQEGETSKSALLIGHIHEAFAFLFFLTLIIFSLVLFTNTEEPLPSAKRHRNWVYKACGYVMSICLVLSAVLTFLSDRGTLVPEGLNPVFWLETIAIEAFGISWFIKGYDIELKSSL